MSDVLKKIDRGEIELLCADLYVKGKSFNDDAAEEVMMLAKLGQAALDKVENCINYSRGSDDDPFPAYCEEADGDEGCMMVEVCKLRKEMEG